MMIDEIWGEASRQFLDYQEVVFVGIIIPYTVCWYCFCKWLRSVLRNSVPKPCRLTQSASMAVEVVVRIRYCVPLVPVARRQVWQTRHCSAGSGHLTVWSSFQRMWSYWMVIALVILSTFSADFARLIVSYYIRKHCAKRLYIAAVCWKSRYLRLHACFIRWTAAMTVRRAECTMWKVRRPSTAIRDCLRPD